MNRNIAWESWRVFFADERCVALDADDSNYKACATSLFQNVPIPRENIITIENEDLPDVAARIYERRLLDIVPDGSLDLCLLGLGPDGHTASLFPGHDLVSYNGDRSVMPIFDSPKPPAHRITLTLPTINKSKQVIFVATGSSKSDRLLEIYNTYTGASSLPPLPSALVRSISGDPLWIIDREAASKLPSPRATVEDL